MATVARNGRGVQILGVSLALLNLALWFCVPAIRAYIDEMTGRWSNAHNPLIVSGVQELLVYFDPWLARGVFPVIYTLGFAAIPFLKKASGVQTGSRPGRAYSVVLSLLLIGLEMVWLAKSCTTKHGRSVRLLLAEVDGSSDGQYALGIAGTPRLGACR